MEPVPMRMYSVSPNHGPQTGGTFVVVKGQAFPHNKRVYCSFQTLVVPAMWINSRTVQCPSPRYTTTSKVSVEVSTDQMTWIPGVGKVTFGYDSVKDPEAIVEDGVLGPVFEN